MLYVYLNRSFNYLIYSPEVLFLAEWWSGSDVRVFASDESFQNWGKEHALIIMNHSYEVDWLMGWIVADRSKILGVSCSFSLCSLLMNIFIQVYYH